MSNFVNKQSTRRKTKRTRNAKESNKENVNNEEETTLINKILNVGSKISHYKIIFLPEENDLDPIKSIFSKEEWIKLKVDWCETEKELSIPLDSGISEDTKVLLKIFSRDWPREWIQSVYKAFLLCFQLPVNPLHDRNLSEYAYRDRIVNRLIEDIFLDANNAINMRTGEIENTDRKVQKNLKRSPEQKRAIGWSHDALLMIKVNSSDRPVGFGEVVGNACYHNDKKMTDNREKILISMQLGFSKLQQILEKRGADKEGFKNIETFGILVYKRDFYFYVMHYVNGLYLVNKFDEFAIPDNVTQFSELSDIIKILFAFKHRVIQLHLRIQNLLKGKCRNQQEPHHTGETVTIASLKGKRRRCS
ncbi:hypothetical protein Glove_319g48 [Diversispora epigaea]|uniref:Uncharacterized protein n=1 Tax=Diversispora epigaea TaxID=1348612 RepID=A0A397HPQ7_9GLOM|nr:hypothetical protein Glove_319g48 [Diversispora epigaea]